MDVEERFDLQHGADATVAGALVPAFEQPAIDLLSLEPAGFDDVAPLGVGVIEQVAHQPQVQGVDLGDETLIRQVVGAWTVGLVEPHKTFVGELFRELGALEVRAHKGVEAFLAGLRQQVAVHGGHADRGWAHAVEKGVEAVLGVLVLVLLPELEQERSTLAVGEFGQVFLTPRVAVILEQFGTAVRAGVGGVAHQITHQANERQVDRLAQGVAQGRDPTVIFLAEVVEHMQAAPGEKRLTGAG